jgi:tetratricopeptide (TPR) repeat protein
VGGDAAGALAAFDRALALDPKHRPSLYNRAGALDALGRHADAVAALDKLLKLDPKHQPSIDARARLSAKRKG